MVSTGQRQEQGSVVRASVEQRYRVVTVGASAGGMTALLAILLELPSSFPLPIVLAQHLHKTDAGRFAEHLDARVALQVAEARDKQWLEAGHLYVAPADYHLLLEREGTLALSIDPKVNWARPSIDVLFESAARAFGDAVIGIILSGANDDGARGMKVIGELGGLCVAQDPATAESPVMPTWAIDVAGIATVLSPTAIGELLAGLAPQPPAAPSTTQHQEGSS